MLPKKERTKQRKNKRARERGWFWSLDTTTCYTWSYIPLHRYPRCSGLEPRPLLYLLPTKYIFQPCSLAHSSEIISVNTEPTHRLNFKPCEWFSHLRMRRAPLTKCDRDNISSWCRCLENRALEQSRYKGLVSACALLSFCTARGLQLITTPVIIREKMHRSHKTLGLLVGE